jgi:hypothetical protein
MMLYPPICSLLPARIIGHLRWASVAVEAVRAAARGRRTFASGMPTFASGMPTTLGAQNDTEGMRPR